MKQALAIPFAGTTVVVTHHAPHKGSIHPRFQGDGSTAGFVSHLPELVERASLWVHGHVHDPFDDIAGDCRIICNPLGYRGEHDGFNETLVLDTAALRVRPEGA